MTKEEYDNKLKGIEEAYKKEKDDLALKYGVENVQYKLGNIIEDNCNKIKITSISIGFTLLTEYPVPIYKGIILKKDGTPRKKVEYARIYQNNIKEG